MEILAYKEGYKEKLAARAKQKFKTREQSLADEISKTLGLPFREIYFGALVGDRKIGWEGVYQAYKESLDAMHPSADFRKKIKEQKESIWKQ